MATSSKVELSSDSPDRPLYNSGQRGSYIAAQLDRSSSFRENVENPILSSLPNMTRSSSVVAQGDVLNFFQCLPLDPKAVVADHKSSRQGDFKRHISVALGISGDDSPSGLLKGKVPPSPLPDEIKRVKAGLRESCVKARERVEIFSETLSVFNKCFPSIPSKKRSRSESFANDRSNSLSSDRSALGPNLNKMGIQNHAATSSLELEHQKSEKRTKNNVPNKRTRTSMVDGRGGALVRSSGTVDRDREMLRLAPNGAGPGDDRTLSIGVDGWEKTKMKKKRSGIKPDISSSLLLTKPADGYREAKQGMQQRPVADARSRLGADSHGFRPGVANGANGVGKSDGISHPNGLTVRSSIPKADLDNNSPLNDRKERPGGSDKVSLRAVNKSSVRDDFHSASPTSSIKMNSSIRAPRSGSGIAPKLSPVVHRSTAPNDWELSVCTNKPPTVGVNNRKRTASVRSSSPPVAHWAGQRPQKISRTARRTNLIPIVSNNDESPAVDTVSDVSGNETGIGSTRRLSSNSPQQVKLKTDPLSSTALSESEESGATEIKSKDKGRKSDETDEKAVQNVQKVSNPVMPSRKNKLVAGEDIGDGIRKGRTGRGFASTRSLMPMTVEKLANVGTAKQLRSARVGSDKIESKTGRPPTRKLSDRKAYTRQKHTTVNAAADFHDDGHEELLAAASSVINPAHCLSSSFWKQMEPFFGLISDIDIAHLEQQRNFESAQPVPTPIPSIGQNCSTRNEYGWVECERAVGNAAEPLNFDLPPEHLAHESSNISLCQSLLAAIISEEDCTHVSGELECNAHGTEFELDEEFGTNGINHMDKFEFSGHKAFNGYRVTEKRGHDDAEFQIFAAQNASNFSHSTNGILSDQKLKPNMACPPVQYDNMCMSEKLLLELQSIGIVPDMQMEDEGISGEISKLEDMRRGQVSKKKSLVDKLLKSSSDIKVHQEKELIQRAHDKLVAMAYDKYMTCWGPNATGGKSSSNKMAKQAALTFVKRTLDRCHKFEDTGKSCFSEPLFKDIFLSALSGAQSVDASVDSGSAKLYTNNSNRTLEARVSASINSQPSPHTLRLGPNGDSHTGNSSDLLPPANHLVEQSNGKEDTWSNRVKKRELLLEDVGGTVGTSSSSASGIGGSLSSSTKGKRSERDREGKGHNREVVSRSGTNKIGRPALSSAKGERKSKTKPRQKTTQLSVSMNGLVGKADQPKATLPSAAKSSEITSSNNAKETDGFGLEMEDPIDLSHLQLPGIDVLDDSQGQDLGSWLNIDDDGLQDHDDFMGGLEIPMDDLTNINMMV
ncbi:hypothetical protein Tsubulata_003248 [Turnera subulata]|uniref:Uncharacterized protein n=1 Tax=Turnera subulata TaxID=218843 RepID=A0A9Q0JSJ3_9ROSI|nr:hypothetical protein Tsubulata_003248 [Turnera subulata]